MNYLAACKRILEKVSRLKPSRRRIQRSQGRARITAPIVFGRLHVVPLVNDFLISFPEINVRMMFADRSVNLLDDHIDMAVRIGALAAAASSRRVSARSGASCAQSGYFASHGRQDARRSGAATCVTFSACRPAHRGPSRQAVVSSRPRRRGAASSRHGEGGDRLALAGVGITHMLSYQVAGAYRTEGLSPS